MLLFCVLKIISTKVAYFLYNDYGTISNIRALDKVALVSFPPHKFARLLYAGKE